MRRATHENVDCRGSGFFQLGDARLASRAANDGIIDHDHTLALHQFGNQVQLHAHVEVPDQLRRLEEASANVVVPDECHFKGQAGFKRVTESGAIAAVRHGYNQVCRAREFAGKLAPHLDARLVNVPVGDRAVWPGEVDILEDAEGAAFVVRKSLDASDAALVDDDNLARLDVADELGVNKVEGAGFTCEHPAVAQFAKAQWTEPVRIPDADQFLLRHDDEREGAFDAADGFDEIVLTLADGRLGHEVQDDLAIDGGLEDRAASFELFAQLGGIGEVAIVRDGDLAPGAIDREWLGVAQVRSPGGRVTGVADSHRAHEVMQDPAIENLRDQSHALVGTELLPIARDNASALLAAMLQGVKAVISQLGGIGVAVNAEHAAIMLWVVVHELLRARLRPVLGAGFVRAQALSRPGKATELLHGPPGRRRRKASGNRPSVKRAGGGKSRARASAHWLDPKRPGRGVYAASSFGSLLVNRFVSVHWTLKRPEGRAPGQCADAPIRRIISPARLCEIRLRTRS